MLTRETSTEDDYHHLLTFKDHHDANGTIIKKGMDDVKALFALFAIAMFSNAFDKRTYMPLPHGIDPPSPKERDEQWEKDLNAIPLLERRHYCYTRGLALDLLHWFFNRYGLSKPMQEADDAYTCLLAPFTGELGRKMVLYKFQAAANNHGGVCTPSHFEHQIQNAIFGFADMKEAYEMFDDNDIAEDDMAYSIDEPDPSFAFDFDDYNVAPYESVQQCYVSIEDFFECGKNMADCVYFSSF